MKRSVNVAVLCLGTALALTTAAQAQQNQQSYGHQMGQQPFGTQQQQGGQQFGQQMTGQMQGQQQLSEQRIRSFFKQAQNVLQQTARTQDPGQLQQYLQQYVRDGATITSASDLYLGDEHVATTIAKISDETALKALGHAASALHGRSLVDNYNIDIQVQDIEMLPGQNAARVTTVIRERGTFEPPSPRVAQAGPQQQQQQFGSSQQQWGQGQDQQFGQGNQRSQQLGQGQQGWPQQSGQLQQGGSGMGFGQGRGGGVQQGSVHFQSNATCTNMLSLDQGQIKIGDTFCRGSMRLG